MPACQPAITGPNTETDKYITHFSQSKAADDIFHAGYQAGLLNLPCAKT